MITSMIYRHNFRIQDETSAETSYPARKSRHDKSRKIYGITSYCRNSADVNLALPVVANSDYGASHFKSRTNFRKPTKLKELFPPIDAFVEL